MAKRKPTPKKSQKKTTRKKTKKQEDKSIVQTMQEMAKENENDLVEMFGDINLAIFFMEWLNNNRNATKAFAALHPGRYDLSDKKQARVCSVMGSNYLGRIDISRILDAYGIGLDKYLKKIKDGIDAKTKEAFVLGGVSNARLEVVEHENHEVQLQYHTKLGKILKIEQDENGNQNNTQVNINFGEALRKASEARGLQP